MPPRIKLDFFYDIGSPYSYLAFEILLRYEQLWNLDLQLQPVLLGGVFKLTGNSSPAATQYKRAHMMNDISRVSQEFQIPFSPGPEFPGNTMQTMKMLRYLKDELSPAKFKEATRHYFKENFQVGTALSSPDFVASLPTDILPAADMEVALVKSKEKRISELMKAESTNLVETHGAFGFPWMVVHRSDGEVACYFGSDRFANMAWWLGPEYHWMGPVPVKSNL
ncbi:hypothetical protein M408DRAFT_174971 [Serendipita vermifera MAFF 305830]|uniref:Glutathione S-transferase kappa n=1 Tax=Serendipita vermifera MAFF 305830 TaxID=933852 RepID=A0A0C2WKP2_SERVB|nr:hypothetical protein M408DRAFT_174971 [Serendipita vermifera MAFF 305830]